MVGPVAQAIAGIALDALAVLVEDRQRNGVIGDQIILAQEDVQLLELERLGLGNDPGHVKNDVKIFAPVVHLGNVRFLECILDGQRMKMEVLAQPVLEVSCRRVRRVPGCRPKAGPLWSLIASSICDRGQSAWKTPEPSR